MPHLISDCKAGTYSISILAANEYGGFRFIFRKIIDIFADFIEINKSRSFIINWYIFVGKVLGLVLRNWLIFIIDKLDD